MPAYALIAGDLLGAQDRWDQAAEAYRRAANLEFGEATALRLFGALRRANRLDEAGSVLDLLGAQHPRNVAAALLASDAALAVGQWRAAEALLQDVRRRSGDRDAVLLNNLGWARLNLGQAAQAVGLGQAAYALAPNNAAVTASYGWFLARSGMRERGAALLEKAVALAPDVPVYATRLAEVRAKR